MTEVNNLEEILARWKAVIEGNANEGAEAGFQHGLKKAYDDIYRAVVDLTPSWKCNFSTDGYCARTYSEKLGSFHIRCNGNEDDSQQCPYWER